MCGIAGLLSWGEAGSQDTLQATTQRMGDAIKMAGTTNVSASGNQDIDGLIEGVRWTSGALTFSFPTSAATYGSATAYSSSREPNTFAPLNATQQNAVVSTLALFSSFANLTFSQVTETTTTHATLRYAMSSSPSTAWGYYPATAESGGDVWMNKVDYNNPVYGNYAWLSFMHETGHALGLKHGQQAAGGFPALPAAHNSVEYSIMTYAAYIGDPMTGGYAIEQAGYPQTPMMDDIAALQYLYGPNFNSNSGNTTYVWSPTTGQEFINGIAQTMPVGNRILMTVWDGGGNDTYDFSGYATNLQVNLAPGGWTTASSAQLSHLDFYSGNTHIAAGNIANALLYNGDPRSLIENAIGGTGDDTILGNQADNVLNGGAGNDTLVGATGNDVLLGAAGRDTLAGGGGADQLTGGSGADKFVFDMLSFADAQAMALLDTVTDYDLSSGAYNFSEGDQIELSALLAGAYGAGQAVASLVRAMENNAGTAATLQVDLDGTGTASTWVSIAVFPGIHAGNSLNVILDANVAGVTIASLGSSGTVSHLTDLDGDGRDDVLWRHDLGNVSVWDMNGSVVNAAVSLGSVPSPWHIEGTGDFNADGTGDIVWRHDGGTIVIWEMSGNQVIGNLNLGQVPVSWHIEGIEDFGGDGKSDLLWRNDDGSLVIWQMNGGQFGSIQNLGAVSNAYHIAGTGDFNGDGKGDILWRGDGGEVIVWTLNGNGAQMYSLGLVGNAFHVEGTGDFNGDGIDDILWRHDDGTLVTWEMGGGGATVHNFGVQATTWHVEGTGDFNGDGRDDLLWRDDGGAIRTWELDGGQILAANGFGSLPTAWHVAGHDLV